MDFKQVFSSFSHRNYRYYFAGQGFSLVGTWMQTTAMGWLVYRITGSSSMLGTVGFVTMLPVLFLGYIAGAFSDKIERKKGLFITQFLSMVCAFLIAYLAFFGHIEVWHIMVIGFINGVSGAFDMPLRQSFVVEIVGKENLPNALALNSIMFNLTRMIGPAIAGFIIKYLNESYCFIINFLSYFFIIFALARINPYKIERVKKEMRLSQSLKEGAKYIYDTPYIKYPLIFMMSLSFVVMPVITMMPVYVKYLGGSAATLGMFMSVIGLGAIISGIQMAKVKQSKALGPMISSFSLVYGVALILASLSSNIYFSAICLFAAGMGTSRQAVGVNTLIQSLVREDMRGRVVSIYALSFMGLAPFGNIFWGFLAEKTGIASVLVFCGLWIILCNIWFIRKLSAFKRMMEAEPEGYSFSEYQNLKNIL